MESKRSKCLGASRSRPRGLVRFENPSYSRPMMSVQINAHLIPRRISGYTGSTGEVCPEVCTDTG